ncbi:hypothetical protein F2Q70_00035189 [Brassica cretica]|uniref:Uncharacterized protein n=1 Tax=Brassica cretica TaxID=69181 RepID=A0A8S9JT35_BRACR|nr:hypothetical protein F2Q70_00035189 [Brassica cretica]
MVSSSKRNQEGEAESPIESSGGRERDERDRAIDLLPFVRAIERRERTRKRERDERDRVETL